MVIQNSIGEEPLRRVCSEIIDKYKPVDGKTFCNFAVNDVCKKFGYDKLEGLTANQIYDHLNSENKFFGKVIPGIAAARANHGCLCVAAKKYGDHGHVAVVAPYDMEWSGSLGKSVPVLANVGETNGFLKSTLCFPVKEGEPEYFLLLA